MRKRIKETFLFLLVALLGVFIFFTISRKFGGSAFPGVETRAISVFKAVLILYAAIYLYELAEFNWLKSFWRFAQKRFAPATAAVAFKWLQSFWQFVQKSTSALVTAAGITFVVYFLLSVEIFAWPSFAALLYFAVFVATFSSVAVLVDDK